MDEILGTAKLKDTLADAFYCKKTLRSNPRSRPIVIVRIVGMVVVELQLVVIELEVQGVLEVAIGIGCFVSVRPYHKPLSSDIARRISILYFMRRHGYRSP